MNYWAIALALLWVALQGKATWANLVGGFVLALVILYGLLPEYRKRKAVGWRFIPSLRLLMAFLKDLLLANVTLLAEILGRNQKACPGILEIPLDLPSDSVIATFANYVTLTPGTLSLHVSDDKKSLFIHSMFASVENEEAIRQDIYRIQRLVREASQ